MAERTHEQLRTIRWTLLEAQDRLRAEVRLSRAEPFGIRLLLALTLWVLIQLVALAAHIISLPITLTRSPQASFALIARRRGDTFVESYSHFKRTVLFIVGLVIVTTVAATLAFLTAVLLSRR